MESDSVRTIGENTLVDVWIDGKVRSIVVSRSAIERFGQLPPDAAAALSDDERNEFVRAHLGQVVSAARDCLRKSDPDADKVVIDAEPVRSAGDRREGDRRKGERRKSNLGPPRPGERRRG
jgi:hypothetical protein